MAYVRARERAPARAREPGPVLGAPRGSHPSTRKHGARRFPKDVMFWQVPGGVRKHRSVPGYAPKSRERKCSVVYFLAHGSSRWKVR